MLRKILTGLMLASLLLGVVSCAKKEPAKITIATDATLPPMEMVDTNKNIVGFDIDLMNAAAKAGGFTVEFKNTAWDGIFAGLDNGKYDAVMSSVTITDERKKTMDFSIPYINAGQILVVQSGDERRHEARRPEGQDGRRADRHHRRLRDRQGQGRGQDQRRRPTTRSASRSRTSPTAASTRWSCDNPTAANYALQNDKYKGKLKIVGERFTEEYYGVAVKKGNTKVLDVINAGLKKVLDAGDNKAIEDKWLK